MTEHFSSPRLIASCGRFSATRLPPARTKLSDACAKINIVVRSLLHVRIRPPDQPVQQNQAGRDYCVAQKVSMVPFPSGEQVSISDLKRSLPPVSCFDVCEGELFSGFCRRGRAFPMLRMRAASFFKNRRAYQVIIGPVRPVIFIP